MSETEQVTWQNRLLAATKGTQTGAIAKCVLGRNVDGGLRQYVGKATITSDGFVMCSFTDAEGQTHMGAFVGDVDDLRRNVIGVADHLKLSDAEREAWYRACRAWIALDYSDAGIGV
jgi:hypothetical protein